jgi:hypothetical protein
MPGDVPHSPPPNPHGGQQYPGGYHSFDPTIRLFTDRIGWINHLRGANSSTFTRTVAPRSHHDDPAVRASKGVRRQTVAGQLKAHRRNERIGGWSWVCLTTELLS